MNARTDVLLQPGDRPTGEVLGEAVERGLAYLEAGATCVFVPGKVNEDEVEDLVAGIGEGKVSLIGVPGNPSSTRLEELGVARISYGPWTQRVALTAYADLARSLYGGGTIPLEARPLN